MGVLDATGSLLGVNEQFCVRKADHDEGHVLLKRVDIKGNWVFLSGQDGEPLAGRGPRRDKPEDYGCGEPADDLGVCQGGP